MLRDRRGLYGDTTVAAALFALACAPFLAVIRHSGRVPAGLDLIQHYSNESVIRWALDLGYRVPLWNPFVFSGFPIQADMQTSLFYPLSIVLRPLSVPEFLTWTVIVHVWLFGVGSYALCRVWGLSRAVSATGAVALMFGGSICPRIYAGHLDVLRTAAWIPLILTLAVRSVERESVRPSTLLVLACVCQVLAGYAQIAVYTFSCIALYALFSAYWPRRGDRSWRRMLLLTKQLVILAALVAGCTAFQLLPAARLAMAAGRIGGIPYDVAVQGTFGIDELTRTITPLPDVGNLGPEGWETSVYVGLLLAWLVPLAVVARKYRRAATFFFLLGSSALLVASGGPVYVLHHALFPMFRIPGRALVFLAVSVCLLGCIGLESVTERYRSVWRTTALAVAAAIVVTDLSLYASGFVQPRAVQDHFLQSLPFTPTKAGRVLSLCENRVHSLELAALAVPNVDGYDPYFLADYARYAHRARGEAAPPFDLGFPRIGDEPTLPDLASVSALNVTEIVSCAPLMDDALRPIARSRVLYVYANGMASGRIMPALLSQPCSEFQPGQKPLEVHPSTDDTTVSIGPPIADRPDGMLRFWVSASRPHLLLLSEPFYPERRARIDSREVPVYKANTALSAVCVDEGAHVIELRYVPTALRLGTAISAATVVMWIGASVLTRRRTQ